MNVPHLLFSILEAIFHVTKLTDDLEGMVCKDFTEISISQWNQFNDKLTKLKNKKIPKMESKLDSLQMTINGECEGNMKNELKQLKIERDLQLFLRKCEMLGEWSLCAARQFEIKALPFQRSCECSHSRHVDALIENPHEYFNKCLEVYSIGINTIKTIHRVKTRELREFHEMRKIKPTSIRGKQTDKKLRRRLKRLYGVTMH